MRPGNMLTRRLAAAWIYVILLAQMVGLRDMVIVGLAYSLLAVVDYGLSRRTARERPSVSQQALTLMQGAVVSSAAPLLFLHGGEIAPLLSAFVLAGGLLIAILHSSGRGFWLVAAPYVATMCLVVPLVTIEMGKPAETVIVLAGGGGLLVFFSAHVARLLSRVLAAEAEARADAEQGRAAAEAATEAKSAFIATVSHELRTPMSAILTTASVLERASEEASSRANAALISSAARMMRTILNDLLDSAKIEAGRMTVEEIAFDARDLMKDTIRFWVAELRAHGLRLKLTGARHLPPWIMGDPTRLRQILNNLLSNAAKFTATGSVTIRIGRLGRDRLTIEISDTGCGMTDEQVGRLFARFVQADDSVSRTHGGTGLGLAISRELGRLMGGELTASSHISQGSTFRLELPLRLASPQQTVETPNGVAGRARAFDVLVVDDNPVNREAMRVVLEAIGATVTTAADGNAALVTMSLQPFDLVLTDLHMPGLDGLEMTRRIRASVTVNANTPIIAVSGEAGAETRERCLAAGLDGLVEKPIEPAELFREIDAALAVERSPEIDGRQVRSVA